MRLTSSALALFVAAIVPSQTYVVDAAGGPGSNFTSIAAATSAVPDGSVLLVRAGSYGGFVITSKGLTVLADPGVVVQPTLPPLWTIVIQNTTPTQPVVLRNLVLNGAGIGCTSCAGPVLFDQIHPAGPYPAPALLEVSQCPQVMATSSVFRGAGSSPATRAISSQFALVNSSAEPGYGAGAGIWMHTSSRVQVVSSVVSANNFAGSAAIYADAGSDLRLLGNTTLSAPYILSAAVMGNPTVRRALTVTLTGLVVASSLVTVDDESLSGTGGALGGGVSATLNGANGNLAVLVLGVTGPPLFVPGITDSWWLDPAVSASVAFAVQSGPLTATVAIPPTPALQGELYGFQGLFLTPTGLSVSNPYQFVIR